MTDDDPDSSLPFASTGGVAIVGGVVCCVGVKLVGGAVLFGGLATTVGLTTDQTTFVVGGFAGLLLAVFLFGYRRVRKQGATT